MKKIFQISYMLVFFILAVGIAGNVDTEIETPVSMWLVEIITGILTMGKILYVKEK